MENFKPIITLVEMKFKLSSNIGENFEEPTLY